jgi:hypothetical protein
MILEQQAINLDNDKGGIAVHLSVFEPNGGVLENPGLPPFLRFVTEPTSSGCLERP